jgi:hypothetical protein
MSNPTATSVSNMNALEKLFVLADVLGVSINVVPKSSVIIRHDDSVIRQNEYRGCSEEVNDVMVKSLPSMLDFFA